MRGFRQTLLVLLLTIISGVTIAQNNTNSPYTRYGFGRLSEQGGANSKAMGGIAYALRDRYQINHVNPASYTAVDSLTFIFDGGLSLQNANMSNGKVKQNVKNSSFDYITMHFRAAPWAGISVGLLPYSNIGYNMYQSVEGDAGNSGDDAINAYTGDGGLHQIYLGAGFKILKNLSVGVNVSYLWGDLTHSRYLSFSNNTSALPFTEVNTTSISGYKIDLGVQYTHEFSKKHSATFGMVYSPGHKLSSSLTQQTQTGSSSGSSTTVTTNDLPGKYELPATLGMGVTYNYNQQLTVGAGVTHQNWGKASFTYPVMNDGSIENVISDNYFRNRTKVALGAEYIPNPMGRNYLARIKYRVGGYYAKPYYQIEGSGACNEYGVTAGFGLPIPRTYSVVSMSLQYARTEAKQANFIDENTLRICIGLTFNERWFFKRKVN